MRRTRRIHPAGGGGPRKSCWLLIVLACTVLLATETGATRRGLARVGSRRFPRPFPYRGYAYTHHKDDEILEGRKVYKNPRNAPSDTCPRDDQTVVRTGRTCLRRCASNADCLSKRKVCLCDGACGLTCVKPDKTCGDLENPIFGFVELNGKFVGSQAKYKCQQGYHLIGETERTCQGDGAWSFSPPECRENLYCTDPPKIAHARHDGPDSQTRFAVNHTLTFTCYQGYETKGFASAKCFLYNNTMQWFGPEIACEPKSCGDPGEIANGYKDAPCYVFACRINYLCRPGFELVGRSSFYCQHDGAWNPRELPSCKPIQCVIPEDPHKGRASFQSVLYNDVVRYKCNHGFMLVGNATRTCGTDRKWTGSTPHCVEINCGSPGDLHNGWLDGSSNSLGSVVKFRCNDNMKYEGNPERRTVCLMDGSWSHPLPKCLAPCIVPTIENGNIWNQTRSGSLVSHGTVIKVECKSSYEETFHGTPSACYNGTWSHYPHCQPARCKKLPKRPRHGMVLAPRSEHGTRARFRCKDGFRLSGSATTQCHYGKWNSTRPPRCKIVYCPFPGTVDNGRVLLVGNMGMYDYRAYVKKVRNNRQIRFECHRGYYLSEGPPGATCVAGRWSPNQLPKCKPKLHPILRWMKRSANASEYFAFKKENDLKKAKENFLQALFRTFDVKSAIYNDKNDSNDNDDINGRNNNYINDINYSSNASNHFEKLIEWTPNIRKEVRNVRKMYRGRILKKIEKLQIRKDKDIRKHRKEEFLLATDKGMNKNDKRSEIKRMMKSKSTNGTIRKRERRATTDDNQEQNSKVRNKWKKKEKKVPCSVPAAAHGQYMFNGAQIPERATIGHAEVIKFSCQNGYTVLGSDTIRCWYGEWTVTGSNPECQPDGCLLPELNHGQYSEDLLPGKSKVEHGVAVNYTCETGWLVNVPTVTCQLGKLSPGPPTCLTPAQATDTGPQLPIPIQRTGSLISFADGDITSGGDITRIDLTSDPHNSCSPPAKIQGTIIYKNGQPLLRDEKRFPDGTEVTFNCISNTMGEKTTWMIRCDGGSWVGQRSPYACGVQEDDDLTMVGNISCTWRNSQPNLVTFFRDKEITEDVTEFEPGTELVSRCVDIGKFALVGSTRRRCLNGHWTGETANCFALNRGHDYALDRPPTILFRHKNGPIAQTNDGRLLVYPGAQLYLECLWMRRYGTPRWNVTHTYPHVLEERLSNAEKNTGGKLSGTSVIGGDNGKYWTGWTTEHMRDPQLEFRLAIYTTHEGDSGDYTCITPTGHSHTVTLEIKEVDCLPLEVSPEDTRAPQYEPKGITRLGTVIRFSCSSGSVLSGAREATCLPSGNWSAPLPRCEKVVCPPPVALKNGEVLSVGPFTAGDVLEVKCRTRFMLVGQPRLVCQDSGNWSSPLPHCSQACTYPGIIISGTMSSVKFYYPVNDTVKYTCSSEFELHGVDTITCLEGGKWSGPVPTCLPRT